jgi:hypothetical protein
MVVGVGTTPLLCHMLLLLQVGLCGLRLICGIKVHGCSVISSCNRQPMAEALPALLLGVLKGHLLLDMRAAAAAAPAAVAAV